MHRRDALTAAVAGSIEEFTKFLAVLRTVEADCDPCVCNNAAAVVHPSAIIVYGAAAGAAFGSGGASARASAHCDLPHPRPPARFRPPARLVRARSSPGACDSLRARRRAQNVEYALAYGWETAAVRAFSAVPLHVCTATIMGSLLGQQRFLGTPRPWHKVLLLPMALHASYDFSIFVGNSLSLADFRGITYWWYMLSLVLSLSITGLAAWLARKCAVQLWALGAELGDAADEGRNVHARVMAPSRLALPACRCCCGRRGSCRLRVLLLLLLKRRRP